MHLKSSKTRKTVGTDPVSHTFDTRRLQYMRLYGNLKDDLIQMAGRNPEFNRSHSEPTGNRLIVLPPSAGFSNPPLSSFKREPRSPMKSEFPSLEEHFGDCHQPLISHFGISKCLIDSPSYSIDLFPLFTYGATLTHIVIFIAQWIVYGLSPTGSDLQSPYMSVVSVPNQTKIEVCWFEPQNMLIGLRLTELIRTGARYPPCMRFDPALHTAIVERQKNRDRASGCCVLGDGQHCYQTSRISCASSSATWLNLAVEGNLTQLDWPYLVRSDLDSDKIVKRNGPVCGIDPHYCLAPKSTDTMPWSEDITKWPICEHSMNVSENALTSLHMQCGVTGRPCCFGIRGECVITTPEHCSFIRGTYHSKAALCSQVNCLKSVCGLGLFLSGEYPDQFYRLFTSLFIHSGLIPLVITVWLQLTFMRNLERFVGFWIIGIVYLFSGCFANLLAGYFQPYQVGTGPAASLMGLAGFRAMNYFFYSGRFSRSESSTTNTFSSKFESAHGSTARSPDVFSRPTIDVRHKNQTLRSGRLLIKLRNLLDIQSRISIGLYKNVFLNLLLFLCGTMPWIDNFALLGGFTSGTLLTFVVMPYRALNVRKLHFVADSHTRSPNISPSPTSRRRRIPIEDAGV